ncbi:MAG: hypothetical protein ACREND_11835 [Gemmatimonadaceae bacterium]
MTDTNDYLDYHDVPIYRELSRIFGDPETEGATKFFLLLPLVSEKDALAFFRTVPAGTPWEALEGLLTAYRAANPVRDSDSDDSDDE